MTNKEVIENFYSAFQNLDSKSMNVYLADDVVFEDPAFGKLKGDHVKYMWQFLCENAKDFKMEFSEISAKGNKGKAHWEAYYTFSQTGNTVHNIIDANFEIKDGLIIKHQDDFDIKRWVKQAMGPAVGLIGGSFLMKNAVRKKSNSILASYIRKNALL
ncbi:MAG: limonene-1,2-epoxide hydrolase [Planctomycetota bacterium]|jgi:limonene-1,2-epoxide hydrolase